MDHIDMDAAISQLTKVADPATKAAIIDLAAEPSSADRPDAARFGPATARHLTALGVLDEAGFVTEFGLAAGGALRDRNARVSS